MIIWFFAILLAIPMALFHEHRYIPDPISGSKPFCSPYPTVKTVVKFDPETYAVKRLKVMETATIHNLITYDQFMILLLILQYGLPILILAFYYAKMYLVLWAKNPSGSVSNPG